MEAPGRRCWRAITGQRQAAKRRRSAHPAGLVRLVVDDAARLVFVGLLSGVLAASLGERFLEARVTNLMPNSITAWVVVPVVVLLAGLVAAFVPAHAAARLDPDVVLREL